MANKKLLILSIVIFFLLLYFLNMAYFSIKPDFFSVKKNIDTPSGTIFTETTVKLMENELNGSGGWTPNDIPPSPTWFLDNKPNFQLGVLEAVRYSVRVLRDNLSRQRTSDKIDPDCDKAFTSFSNDPFKWIIPKAEGKYREGDKHLNKYIERLKYGNANFYPRSDSLIQLMEQYASLIGGINQRLLNASIRNKEKPGSISGSDKPENKINRSQNVPWTQIDDDFYYAQGVGYALYHLFKAIRIDFASVLKDKNTDVIVDEIIDSLEESYFEPIVVTNGRKNGIFANHSSNLKVFLDDARQKINSLVRMLDQG